MNRISSNDMPAPDQIVAYSDGSFAPAMFHFLHEGIDVRDIARENGFVTSFLSFESVVDEDDPLARRYEDGDADVVKDWTPPDGTDGWTLSGKYDTEDGPVAIYLKPLAAQSKDEHVDA